MISKISKLDKIGKFSSINQEENFKYGGKGKIVISFLDLTDQVKLLYQTQSHFSQITLLLARMKRRKYLMI